MAPEGLLYYSLKRQEVLSTSTCLWLPKPKFHYVDFHQNFPAVESCGHKSWKSRKHLCHNVCSKVRNKPVCVVLVEFNPLQCTGKVSNKVSHKSWKSATWFVSSTKFVAKLS